MLLRSLLLAAFLASASAAEWLVVPPPHGDDAGAGTADRPWATIAHALTRARSGDTIRLLRGATYRERALTFPAGVTIAAAGPADRPAPVITTSVIVPALAPWKQDPRIITAPVARRVLECYVGGEFRELARFPNDGWLRAGTGSDPDAIVLPGRGALPGAAKDRWTGAQVRWRRWSWWWETRRITADDGAGRLALGPENRFQDPFTGVGSAFRVDDCLAELDAPGEWFWDEQAGMLYVWPPTVGDEVEVVVESAGFRCEGATLDGVAFARIAGGALTIGRPSIVRGCAFRDIGDTAITTAWDCAPTSITGCAFADVRNVAVNWNENPAGPGGSVVERCALERIGMRPGYGGSGSWHAAGMIITNANSLAVRLNRIVDTGYAGIIVGRDGQTVERNVLVRCMSRLNDGAAIYVNCSRTLIRENIVLDTIGDLDTSHPWYPLGHGIWCEFLGDFREQRIIANTVACSGGHGLFLTNNYRCEVRDNVLVGDRLSGLHLSGDKGPQEHVVENNLIAVVAPSRRLAPPEHIPGDWRGNDRPRAFDCEGSAHFGRIAGTTILASPGTAVATGGGRFDDVASWAQARPWADAGARLARATTLLLINDTEAAHEFAPPAGAWSDAAGAPVGKRIAVAPFRSVVLARGEAVEGLPPYLLASGIDYRAPPSARPAAQPRPATARRASRPVAKEPAPAATADPAARSRWLAALRERTASAARGAKPPRFRSRALRGIVEVRALDGDQATLALEGGGAITADLFGRIAPEDALALAVDLARGDTPEEHALVAFWARVAGDARLYADHLARAGSAGDEVAAAFAEPARALRPGGRRGR